jgi:hypothetical protein
MSARRCLVVALGLAIGSLVFAQAAQAVMGFGVGPRFSLDTRQGARTFARSGFAIGPRFAVDTRPRSAQPDFATGPAFALSTLRISGRVLTAGGTGLAGGTVAADGLAARTQADGSFVLAGARPGQQYTVSAFAPGHGLAQLRDISVAPGQSATGLVFRLPALAGAYRVAPLWPPAGTPSSVAPGGTAIRYFQVQDQTGQPGPPGVAVATSLDAVHFSDLSGVVAVEVPGSRIGSGQPGDQGVVGITAVDGRPPAAPLSFTVRIGRAPGRCSGRATGTAGREPRSSARTAGAARRSGWRKRAAVRTGSTASRSAGRCAAAPATGPGPGPERRWISRR